jgi:hypothetical protein
MLHRIVVNDASSASNPDILAHVGQAGVSASRTIFVWQVQCIRINLEVPGTMRGSIESVAIEKAAIVSNVMTKHGPAIIVAIYDAVTAAGERAVLNVNVLRPIRVIVADTVRSSP